MHEVVCDTSPLQYLHQAGCLDLLPALYGSIIVPIAVAEELAAGAAQGVPLPHLPSLGWLKVHPAPPGIVLPFPADLGRGEREVLTVAAAKRDSLALLDDALARRVACELGIRLTGTLGILLKSKAAGKLASVRPIIGRLTAFGFRLDHSTKAAVLELAGEV